MGISSNAWSTAPRFSSERSPSKSVRAAKRLIGLGSRLIVSSSRLRTLMFLPPVDPDALPPVRRRLPVSPPPERFHPCTSTTVVEWFTLLFERVFPRIKPPPPPMAIATARNSQVFIAPDYRRYKPSGQIPLIGRGRALIAGPIFTQLPT